jgi:hypothetical protein
VTTRAELFRWLAERPSWSRPAGSKQQGEAPPADRRGPTSRAARKAAYALEDSAGRPSRKSTRGSSNRQKNDVQFRMKRRASEARAPERAKPRP